MRSAAWCAVCAVAIACGGIARPDGATDAGDMDGGELDGSVDVDGGDAAVGPLRVTNTPSCVAAQVTSPLPANVGHWAAARLTPTATPISIESIEYDAAFVMDLCSSTIAHTVQVFVATTTTPPSTPPLVVTVSVPEGGTAGETRHVVVDLPVAVGVADGEQLYVAIQMTGAATQTLCLPSCSDPAADATRNYWSNAVSPPYTWATLASLGNDTDLMIDALGTAP